ncbi:MAG: FAD-binding protein, partial [Lachnospiraceae bacterium]|nr:FAD-binding protein [Lachnospiraceae bacterium]
MKEVIIIGSGISGMTCAVRCAELGLHVTLVSPFPSERSQSVMAAGGINAVTDTPEEGDSVASHIEDTLKGGCGLGGEKAVRGLCESAGEILRFLERIGTVFSVDENGNSARRSFGGQSHKRTYYCGSSTGKQIVSALVMEVRRFEAAGLICRKLWYCFHSALIRGGICYGALLFNEAVGGLEAMYADALVMATGGQNALFGKTTGSTQCDGYAAGKLFTQGVVLKNLEFIQYHPTTLETPQKRMLISEAVRGEGGRLFYLENDRRVYFMEEKYGPKGNLMTRDIVSREIDSTGKEVFLDISFLDRRTIESRLPEVMEVCKKYRKLDITKDPIPVAPSVHFFMGGIAVHMDHETSI